MNLAEAFNKVKKMARKEKTGQKVCRYSLLGGGERAENWERFTKGKEYHCYTCGQTGPIIKACPVQAKGTDTRQEGARERPRKRVNRLQLQ